MEVLVFISNFMIPLVIFYVVGFGLLMKKNVYDDFVRGAKDGLTTVVGIMPTLIGVMVGVGILRASGFLDFISEKIGLVTTYIKLPSEIVPLVIVKMFSSSAATGLVLDLFKEYGPDSSVGLIVSIMMSCTETIFYTLSIYFVTVKVRKTRYTLAGALLASLTGVFMSVFLASRM